MGTFYTDGSEQVQLAKLNYLCFTDRTLLTS